MTHKIKLPNVSALLLVNILSTTGWASSVADVAQAGSLLCGIFDKFEPQKNADDNIDVEWLHAETEWEFTEKQRECCKRAIAGLAAMKKVPTGKPSFLLLQAFGLE